MCGILGVVPASASTIPDESMLHQSAALLEHRGPDSKRVHADSGIGLAHTRLALVDLSPRSAQPFWDEAGESCLVYNGEVYNFRQLRGELEKEGVIFRTTGDTEVVLHAIRRWGAEAALRRFEGMFALAVWSRRTGELTLARDRFGIKPLFLAQHAGTLLFSSEVEALRPWMRLVPDRRTMFAFLYGSGGPTNGQTFFENVIHVSPGTMMTVTPGARPSVTRYASIGQLVDPALRRELSTTTADDLVDEVESRLRHSIDQQIIADAPVGVLCSGGVDSSLILALATQAHDDLAVFHADVVGPTSERQAASALADQLGLQLHVTEVRDEDFIDLLPKLTRHHGSPFHLNPHSVPFYRVSQLIRESDVKGVLSGEGADEAYLGYAWLAPGRTARRVSREAYNPSRTVTPPPAGLITSMLEGFTTEKEHEQNEAVVEGLEGEDRTRTIQSLDLLNANLRGLLHRNDTMGMAASVESRFPFLDTDLMRHALNLPSRVKIRRGLNPRDRRHPLAIDKWVLRRLADRHLPSNLSRRPKVPFATSAYARLRVEPGLFVGGFLDDQLKLDVSAIESLVTGAGQSLKSKLVHLETWGRVMIHHQSEEDVRIALFNHVTIDPI